MAEPATVTPEVMTPTQALIESSRCLMCEDSPCNSGCPAGVDVKGFIRALRFENPRRAYELITQSNFLAGVCGIVCPTERLCQEKCSNTSLTTPVRIGELQRFAAQAEYASGRRALPPIERNGIKVAIIGAGPAGLSCAAELARRGYSPVVFERRERPGGMLAYGIPTFRLPQALLEREMEFIQDLGVELQVNSTIEGSEALDGLFQQGFAAVYVGVGFTEPVMVGMPGEDLEGVTSGLEFLDQVNRHDLTFPIGKRVLVIGGGSVAMDVACSAARIQEVESVEVVCLEGLHEMPAFRTEFNDAMAFGVQFHTRAMPLEILGKGGRVSGFSGIQIRWKEPGRFVPQNAEKIPGTEFTLVVDTVIEAIGQRPSPKVKELFAGMETGRGGTFLVVNPETYMTSRAGVFAGGDVCIGCGTTVVAAVGEGRKAAGAIDQFIQARLAGKSA